ncbi:winged helix-turn-helix domain-containing protein [Halobacteriales archaeon QS_3_64_16]|nr:MAG: winged helix-turn-helix domain-containing protein [Halobacteriales archaeon QS_3_64_16]
MTATDRDPDPDTGASTGVDTDVDALDRIEFVARSPARVRMLAALRDAERLTRTDLRARLEASRTTVGRNLEALCERGLVATVGTDYTLTRAGELIATDLLDLAGTIEIARKLEPFLRWVPDGALDIDLREFADAEVIVAKPGDPWAMINQHVQCLKTMDRCQGFLPFTGLHAQEAAHEQVTDHGARSELVLTPEIADVHFSDPNYAPLTEEIVETGRFEYFVYDGDLPYALAVIDDVVQIVVADGDQPRAMVESESATVREWAEEKYESYKRRSEPISM